MMRHLQFEAGDFRGAGIWIPLWIFWDCLHLEIIQERLEREYNLDLVTTAPGVIYQVHKTNGDDDRTDQSVQSSGSFGD